MVTSPLPGATIPVCFEVFDFGMGGYGAASALQCSARALPPRRAEGSHDCLRGTERGDKRGSGRGRLVVWERKILSVISRCLIYTDSNQLKHSAVTTRPAPGFPTSRALTRGFE